MKYYIRNRNPGSNFFDPVVDRIILFAATNDNERLKLNNIPGKELKGIISNDISYVRQDGLITFYSSYINSYFSISMVNNLLLINKIIPIEIAIKIINDYYSDKPFIE